MIKRFCVAGMAAVASATLASAVFAGEGGLRNLPATEKPRFEITDPDWPAEPGEASICLWRDDKLAAVSFTIDDNTVPDHAWWLEQSQKYGFKFTWFVITARVHSGNPYFGEWADFEKLRAAGHDVQSHTVDHFNPTLNRNLGTDDNYRIAIDELEKGLPGAKIRTLAYPGGPNAKNDSAIAAKYYIAARQTRSILNPVNRVDYMNVNSVGNGLLTDGTSGTAIQWLITPDGRHKQLYRGWGCQHFHGLTNVKEPEKSAKRQAAKVLEYLGEHKADFWVGTFTDVAMYGQERDTATLSTSVEGNTLKLSIADKMDDALFDAPLTVKARLDPSWTNVTAKSGEQKIDVQVIEHNGAKYALVPVVPDRGEVFLSPQ